MCHTEVLCRLLPYRDRHRTLLCDWEDFISSRIFTVSPEWHHLTESEFLVKRLAKVPAKIRPLAKYHFLNGTMDYVKSFNGDYASDKEFLVTATKRPESISGTKIFFPDNLELYAAMGKEQRQRKAAEKSRRRS
ncbi:hypothetical protein C8R45DRAFT_1103368 [Mycena sanguinolenta]|nr:hypothetical protein C8R45DRAFT_1103368 [Mycena sanguinolenta]